MKRRVFTLALAFMLLASVLAGCGGGQSTDTSGADAASGEAAAEGGSSGTKIVTLVQYPEMVVDWDPAISYGSDSHVFMNTYETLLTWQEDTDEYKKVLATDYSYSEDGLTWTFNLREGVKFHDGTDFNAEAVRFSFQRAMDLQQGAAYIFDSIQEMNIIDDYTIEFVLDKPTDFAESVSCQFASYIVSPTAVGDDLEAGSKWFYDINICGTGPYMLQSYTKGSEIILTRFDDYWGGWEDNQFDKAVIKMVTEEATRRQMVESGEADIATSITTQSAEALENAQGLSMEIIPSARNVIAFFNMQKAPLDNKAARQALAYAFPYDDVINHLKMGKYGALPTDPIAPASMRGATESLPYSYDLDKAKALLEEAGYADGFEVVVTCDSGYDESRTMLEMWKSELDKIGVTLDIQVNSWDSVYSRAKSANPEDRQDIFLVEQVVDTMTSVGVYGTTIVPDAPWNFSGYEDPALGEELYDAYYQTLFDYDKSTEMLQQVGEKVAEECFIVNLCDMLNAVAIRSDLKGYEPNAAYDMCVMFYECYRE